MCFVKVYGIAFLGQHRHGFTDPPREASGWERAGMLWLATACFALGLFPVFMIGKLDTVSVALTKAELGEQALSSGWLWLVPTTSAQASYSPIVFLLVIAAVFGLTFLLVRSIYHGRVR